MSAIQRLLKDIRRVDRQHPVTNLILSEMIRLLWRPPVTATIETIEIFLDFEVAEAFSYTCPYPMKFTSMAHEQANDPTLSVALNTNMAQYQDLVVTPDAAGLVTLIAEKL